MMGADNQGQSMASPGGVFEIGNMLHEIADVTAALMEQEPTTATHDPDVQRSVAVLRAKGVL